MIYFIQAGLSGPIKVGTSEGRKMRPVEVMTACPYPAYLLATIEGGRPLEYRMHKALVGYRSNGEWFRPLGPVLRLVQAAKNGLDATLQILTEIEAENVRRLKALDVIGSKAVLLFGATLDRLCREHTVKKVAAVAEMSEDALLRVRQGRGSTAGWRCVRLESVFREGFAPLSELLSGSDPCAVSDRLKGIETVQDAETLLARLTVRSAA